MDASAWHLGASDDDPGTPYRVRACYRSNRVRVAVDVRAPDPDTAAERACRAIDAVIGRQHSAEVLEVIPHSQLADIENETPRERYDRKTRLPLSRESRRANDA